ncbi:MAG: acyl-CoA dehydrogenase family protein [Candidatus Rokubacteria bacterium]|nr:acyl-CoA dehydrogenase family protein [Candidatus Rokubacteria bacterium]
MNFEPTETQQLVREMVRTFADKEIKPRAAAIDREDAFPRDLYRRMADLGLLGMTLPAEYGGSGADTVSWAIAEEELARANASLADAQLVAKLMSDVILINGNDEQRARYLPAIARGEKICVIAQTEPGAGSDVAGVQTLARPTADGYVLNGTKRFITLALVCDLAVVVATTDRTKRHEGIALFLVDAETPGFRHGAKDPVMGVRGLETGEIVFEDCHVPHSAVLAPPGLGFKQAMRSLNKGRIGIGSQAVGIAQAAMEEAIAYARERTAFGQPIANFQAIQFMLADMSAQIEAARLLVRKAAWLTDQGRVPVREAAEAKLVASETAVRVVHEALQIHGAAGYSSESTIERLYRDVRLYPIWEGTSQNQRIIISRELLRGPR